MAFGAILKIENTLFAMFTCNFCPGMFVTIITGVFREIFRVIVARLAIRRMVPVEPEIFIVIEGGRFPCLAAVATVAGIAAAAMEPVRRTMLRMAGNAIVLEIYRQFVVIQRYLLPTVRNMAIRTIFRKLLMKFIRRFLGFVTAKAGIGDTCGQQRMGELRCCAPGDNSGVIGVAIRAMKIR